MMYDLPEDLVMEILSRVPATSLRRLRSTCKRWNDLFKDSKFIKKQYSKSAAANQSMVVMLKEVGVYSVNIKLQGVADDRSTEHASKLITLKDSYYNSDQFYIDDIFYCHGLLLCTTIDEIRKFKDSIFVVRLVVWNPCLGQTRWIEPINSYSLCDSFALGYDSDNNYKVLRIVDGASREEIYDYKFNAWRFLGEDVNSEDWHILERGVSLNGNTYWLGYNKSEEDVPMLISFDFSTEKFRRFCLPPYQFSPHDTNACNISMALSVVREEQLLFLHQCYGTLKMEIWVTTNNKIDQTKVLSWSNFLTVDLYTRDICFSNQTSFFIVDEEKKIVVCCDLKRYYSHYTTHIIGEEENGVIEVEFGETNHVLRRPLMFNYVPSLVQIENRVRPS